MLLLSILGVFVLIIGLVLWTPISYEAYYAKYEKIAYDIKFTYLLGIKGIFYQDYDQKNHKVSVFGRTIYKNRVVDEPKDSIDDENMPSTLKQQTKQAKKTILSEKTLVKEQRLKKDFDPKDIDQSTIKSYKQEDKIVKEVKEVNPRLKQVAQEDMKDLEDEIVQETVQTLKRMPYPWIKKLVLDKNTYGAIKQISLCIWRILKYIAPNEWDFELIIGQEDPADTGEMIAKLTMLYPLYYQHGIIHGNYEKECLAGGFLAQGKFSIGGIMSYIIRCMLSKQVRTLIKFIFQIRKEERYGK